MADSVAYSTGISVKFGVDLSAVSGGIQQFKDMLSGVTDIAAEVSDALEEMGSEGLSSFDSLSGTTMELQDEMDGLATSMTDAADSSSNLSDASESAGGGFSNLLGSVGSLGSGMLGLVNTIGFGWMNLQNLGNMATQAATSLLGPAISAETMKTAFVTLMGSTQAATDELSKLDTFASHTPFKTMDIDQAASQLIGFGINANSVIPDLTAMGDALSAVGRGSTANLDSIVNIFGKIQTEGKLTGGVMQQLSVNGINAWAILEKQTGKTKDQLTEMIKQGLIPASDAMKMLTKGIEDNPLYAGGMAKQSQTMTGLISTLKSNWDQLLVSFGSPIIQGLEGSLGDIGNILGSSNIKDFAGGAGQKIADVFTGIGNAIGYAKEGVRELGQVLEQSGIRALGNDFGYFVAQINYLVGTLGGIGKSVFANFNVNLHDTHTVVGVLSVAIKDLGSFFLTAGTKIHEFTSYLGSLPIPTAVLDSFDKFKEVAGTIAKIVAGAFYEAFEKAKSIYENFKGVLQSPGMQMLIDELGKVWNGIKSVTDIIGNTAIKIFNQFKDAFTTAKNAGDDFNKMLSKLTGIPLDKISSIKDKLTPKFTLPTGGGNSNFLNLPQLEKNQPPPPPKGAGGAQSSGSFGPLSQIIDIAGKAGGALKNFGNAISNINMQPFINAMLQLKGPIQNIMSLQWNQFKTVLKDIGQDAKQVGDWFMSSVVPAFKQAAPGFANLGMTILTTIIPAFIQIRGVVMDVVQHAFTTFAPIIEKIIPPLIVFGGILANGIANGFKFIMPYVLQAAKAIGDFAEGVMDRVAPIITNVINGITPVLQNLFKFWNAIWPGMSMVLQGVFKEIVGVIQIAWAIVTGIFNIALDLISGNWSGAWKDMQKMLGGVWDGIKTMVSGAIGIMQGILTGIGGIVNTYLVKPFQDALGSIGGVFSAIGKLISDATTFNWGAIPGDLSSLGVPGFASGIENFKGGWAMVGEKGPELLKLPSGSSVFDNSKTSKMLNTSSELDNFKASSLLSSIKTPSMPSNNFNYPAMAGGYGTATQDIHVHINVNPEISIDKQKLTKAIGDDIGKHVVKQIRVQGSVKK